MAVISENGTRSVQFGIFEVDLRAGELRRNGSKVKLQEQPFQILTLLLEHPGEVVTREELQKKLWPADTFVDFDHSLNAAIRRLRDALGDSAENPRFVETVARLPLPGADKRSGCDCYRAAGSPVRCAFEAMAHLCLRCGAVGRRGSGMGYSALVTPADPDQTAASYCKS